MTLEITISYDETSGVINARFENKGNRALVLRQPDIRTDLVVLATVTYEAVNLSLHGTRIPGEAFELPAGGTREFNLPLIGGVTFLWWGVMYLWLHYDTTNNAFEWSPDALTRHHVVATSNALQIIIPKDLANPKASSSHEEFMEERLGNIRKLKEALERRLAEKNKDA